ncbi:MAG: response regulator [Deltaproteobacteria bacterium]|nr:response regulator [Deltaproteobacteria bacterium]
MSFFFQFRHRLNSLGIQKKVLLLVAFPMALLLGVLTANLVGVTRQQSAMIGVVERAVNESQIVSRLQSERGLSSMFIAQRGEDRKSALEIVRRKTDLVLNTMMEKGNDLERHRADVRRRALLKARQKIDHSMWQHLEMTTFFSAQIQTSLENIAEELLSKARGKQLAYGQGITVLMWHEEYLGQMRAELGRAFARDEMGSRDMALFYAKHILIEESSDRAYELMGDDERNQFEKNAASAASRQMAQKLAVVTSYPERVRILALLQKASGYGGLVHLVLRGTNDVERAEYYQKLVKNTDEMLRDADKLERLLPVGSSHKPLLKTFRETLVLYRKNADVANALLQDGQLPSEVDAAVQIDDGPAIRALTGMVDSAGFAVDPDAYQAEVTEKMEGLHTIEIGMWQRLRVAALDVRTKAFSQLIVVVLVCAMVLAFMVLYVSRGVLKPISLALEFATQMATGKLDNQIEAESNDELGRLLNALQVMQDELREHWALEKRTEEIELASNYKSEFIANLSHELRTPLNSLLLLSQMLADNDKGNLDEEQVKAAEIIQSGGQDLLRLLNDILDLSKVEAGMLSIVPEPIVTRSLLTQMMDLFSRSAEEKGVLFRTLHMKSDVFFASDPMRVEQVLRNLLSNALKFTHEGVVTLRVRQPTSAESESIVAHLGGSTDDDVAASWLCFVVNDTGVGISSEKKEAIFEAFRQADGSTSRAYGGTGLGLTISRRLATLMGGLLTVESEEDIGSTFILLLPRNHFLVPREGEPRHEDGPREQDSCVDDFSAHHDDDDQGAAQKQAEVGEGKGEQSGRVSVRDEKENNRSTTEKNIRNNAAKALRTKTAIAFRALNDDAEQIRNAREAGVEKGPSSENRIHPILVVEADATFARVLESLAICHGHDTVFATNGTEALQVARSSPLSGVLLDLSLPGDNGWDLLWELKYFAQTRHIPVFVVSGKDGLADARKKLGNENVSIHDGEEAMLASGSERLLLWVGEHQQMTPSLQSALLLAATHRHEVSAASEALLFLDEHVVDGMVVDVQSLETSVADFIRSSWQTEVGDALLPIACFNSSVERCKLVELAAMGVVFVDESDTNHLFEHVSLFLRTRRLIAEGLSQEEIEKNVEKQTTRLAGRTVLLVDDDIRNTFALSLELKKKGAAVLLAENGLVAQKVLLEHPEIDLVLMDMMMPVMDGLTATKAIRMQCQFENLPVIALTAKVLPENRLECLDAGCTDYLAKPVDLERLFRTLSTWLPTYEAALGSLEELEGAAS